MCSCDMSGINGYYHYDNVNYSQPIKPEECQFIHLADAVVCVCVCLFAPDLFAILSESVKFSSCLLTFLFQHLPAGGTVTFISDTNTFLCCCEQKLLFLSGKLITF